MAVAAPAAPKPTTTTSACLSHVAGSHGCSAMSPPWMMSVSYHGLCDSIGKDRHDFFCKLLELFQNDTLRRPDWMGHINALQARIGLLQLHDLLDNLLGRAAEKGPTLHCALNGGQSGIRSLGGVGHGLDLLVSQGPHQT